MVALGQQGVGRVKVAVNLSPLQFHRPSFLATLDQMLQQSGLTADQLELELTEGILMDNTESAIEIPHALRAIYIGVSIGDFGTGYSSLSYLRHLPISKVKIDRSFISEVTINPHDAAIVQGMISMAGHLGLKVVADAAGGPFALYRGATAGLNDNGGICLNQPIGEIRLSGRTLSIPWRGCRRPGPS